jgi:hypothetical protein
LYLNGTIRFLFHLDSSSSNEIWKKVTQFVSLYPTNTFLIPRQEAVDVEWEVSPLLKPFTCPCECLVNNGTMNCQLLLFSLRPLVVAPLITIYHFFHSYLGLSYPGSKREVVARTERLSQTATSDEFFWATLFCNSPFCHTLAPIFDFKAQTGQELSAHVWSQDCDSSDNWGKEACQSMVHQPIGWWSGNSPEWITAGDVSAGRETATLCSESEV